MSLPFFNVLLEKLIQFCEIIFKLNILPRTDHLLSLPDQNSFNPVSQSLYENTICIQYFFFYLKNNSLQVYR